MINKRQDDLDQPSYSSIAKVALLILFILMMFELMGCASKDELIILTENSKAIAHEQALAVQYSPETLVIDCSNDKGCGGVIIKYTDARDRQRVTGVDINGTNDVLMSTTPSIIRGITWLGGIWGATEIIGDITSNSGVGNTTIDNRADNGSNSNVDFAKSNTSADISSVSDKSNHDNPIDNSATATPTIVKQPEPIIVEQDKVKVVNPVVVDPVVVNPVIVQPQEKI